MPPYHLLLRSYGFKKYTPETMGDNHRLFVVPCSNHKQRPFSLCIPGIRKDAVVTPNGSSTASRSVIAGLPEVARQNHFARMRLGVVSDYKGSLMPALMRARNREYALSVIPDTFIDRMLHVRGNHWCFAPT
jgi:hypothetical protein